jgi:hypothetical protein
MKKDNIRGEVRITEEILEAFGFLKRGYTDEDSGKTFYHYELPLVRENKYSDLLLITNASDEEDYPIVQLYGADEYEFLYAEPIYMLMNILQSNCVVEGFQLDQQFTKNEKNV